MLLPGTTTSGAEPDSVVAPSAIEFKSTSNPSPITSPKLTSERVTGARTPMGSGSERRSLKSGQGMRAIVVALLTITVLLSIAVNFIRWRLPQQPRLALFWDRKARRLSARAELAVELSIITAACIALPMVAIGLTVLLIALASHLG